MKHLKYFFKYSVPTLHNQADKKGLVLQLHVQRITVDQTTVHMLKNKAKIVVVLVKNHQTPYIFHLICIKTKQTVPHAVDNCVFFSIGYCTNHVDIQINRVNAPIVVVVVPLVLVLH